MKNVYLLFSFFNIKKRGDNSIVRGQFTIASILVHLFMFFSYFHGSF